MKRTWRSLALALLLPPTLLSAFVVTLQLRLGDHDMAWDLAAIILSLVAGTPFVWAVSGRGIGRALGLVSYVLVGIAALWIYLLFLAFYFYDLT